MADEPTPHTTSANIRTLLARFEHAARVATAKAALLTSLRAQMSDRCFAAQTGLTDGTVLACTALSRQTRDEIHLKQQRAAKRILKGLEARKCAMTVTGAQLLSAAVLCEGAADADVMEHTPLIATALSARRGSSPLIGAARVPDMSLHGVSTHLHRATQQALAAVQGWSVYQVRTIA